LKAIVLVVAALLAPATAHAAAGTSKVMFFNRCAGGCSITSDPGDFGDVRTNTSGLPGAPNGTVVTLSEFGWGDTTWNAVMQCLREVYSPYDVTVTDQKPPDGTVYNETMVAGLDSEVQLNGYLGIAFVAPDCSPLTFVISLTFANAIGNDVQAICNVAAQESGHSYGMAHSFEFTDGRSACTDPMSYRGDCGGQRFFRNETAECGEFSPRPCGSCGGVQNTHQKLLNALGPGTPITTPPVVTVSQPAANAQIANGQIVIATASAQRGIKTVELYLNGYKWAEAAGVPWGANGQPEAGYELTFPPDVPDGVIDIVVRAKDDIDISTDATTVTVTKGQPCATADACLAGQRCDSGKCLWDPPVGEVGDSCSFPQFCKSGICDNVNAPDASVCTTSCALDVPDSCPMGFDCLADMAGTPICWPHDKSSGGGCCSTSPAGAAQASLLALGLLVVLRRRRKR
jgi:MYXO-CTERM domain-containing protein